MGAIHGGGRSPVVHSVMTMGMTLHLAKRMAGETCAGSGVEGCRVRGRVSRGARA
jgi:hypothetical protein